MKALGPIPPGWEALGEQAETWVERAGGTPLFVYDRAQIMRKISYFRACFDPVSLHFAVKSNPFLPLVELLADPIDGFDVASAGELALVRGRGRPVSFAGPGKTDTELAAAIAAGATINLESEGEAERVLAMSPAAKLAVRVNPPFALKGAGMKMGGLASPFGVDAGKVPALVRRLVEGGADWRGLHIFAGSQSLSAEALVEAQRSTLALAGEIADAVGMAPPEVNLGGGFGIPYFAGDRPLDLEQIGAALSNSLKNRTNILADASFAIELGRWLVGEAGVYLTRVVDRKESGGRTFLVTDGGLHHMLAASGNFGQLLRRNYPVAIVGRAGAAEAQTVVGCLCTPLDLLADEAPLPRGEVGDLVAVYCAGAYGRSASPESFLGHEPAREMLV